MKDKQLLQLPANFGQPGGPRFLDVLNQHLGAKLQAFVGKSLDRSKMEDMYESVSETVHGLFQRCGRNVGTSTSVWLSQKLYECIKVSDSSILTRDPETWKYSVKPLYERASLADVTNDDLRFIAGLFSDAAFADEIYEEICRRRSR